jgi:hypothetical protein
VFPQKKSFEVANAMAAKTKLLIDEQKFAELIQILRSRDVLS